MNSIDFLGPDDDPQRYNIIKKLTPSVKGTSSDIQLARDKNDRIVAIKSNVSIDEIDCMKRINERKLCKKYIVCFYDLFSRNGQVYLVMEYLDDYIDIIDYTLKYEKKSNIQAKKDITTLMTNIINGYEVMAKNGISHNDIANIMVHPKTLDIKFIDFEYCGLSDSDITYSKYNNDLGDISSKIFYFLNHYMYRKNPKNDYNLLSENEIKDLIDDNLPFTIAKMEHKENNQRNESDFKTYLDTLKSRTNQNQILLYEWLGGNCEMKNTVFEKICMNNLEIIDDLSQKYPMEFQPFQDLEKAIDMILDDQIPFVILLSSMPGIFIFMRKVNQKLRIEELPYIQMNYYIKNNYYGQVFFNERLALNENVLSQELLEMYRKNK
jgi:serine/threonine protein kinase